MDKNSIRNRWSRYVAGGVTEVNDRAIEWWERAQLPLGADDAQHVVQAADVGRLDLISALYYGEPRWWWVIAQYNNILDPYVEVREGLKLLIPSAERVQSLFASPLGGAPSQREVMPSILPIV